MIIELLKKDWRIYRVAILGNLVFILVMYGMIFSMVMFERNGSPLNWGDAIAGAAGTSILATVGLASVYGASAFAIERRERSAIFMATLPIRRGKIVASKLIVAFCAIVAFIVINVLVVWIVAPRHEMGDPVRRIIAYLMGWTLFSFGLAWLLSSFMESAPLAFGITIGVMFGSWIAVNCYGREFVGSQAAERIGVIFAFVVGTASLAGGTILYLRRVAT